MTESAGGHSILMASDGQTSTHAPQSPQTSGSTTAFSSFMEIASKGHDSTQDSQPVHFSGSTTAAMINSHEEKTGGEYQQTWLWRTPIFPSRAPLGGRGEGSSEGLFLTRSFLYRGCKNQPVSRYLNQTKTGVKSAFLFNHGTSAGRLSRENLLAEKTSVSQG
jgi:hypothetical protein